MTQKSLDIISQLSNEGIDIGLIHMHTIAPLDYNIINKIIKNVEYIFTLEEHLVVNGFGTSILEYCSQNFQQYTNKISRIGLPFRFPDQYGNQETLMNHMGLSNETIKNKIKGKMGKK